MRNKGFTMLELLVSLGISSLVVGLILSYFTNDYRLYKSVRNDMELQFHANYILNFMTEKVILKLHDFSKELHRYLFHDNRKKHRKRISDKQGCF